MNKIKTLSLTLIWFACNGTVSLAQDSTVFSLDQAIEYALLNNTDIQNAFSKEQSAIAQKNEIRGQGLPQVNASVDVNKYFSRPTSLIPDFINGNPDQMIEVQFGTEYNATAGINFSQLLFSGEYIVALESSKAFVGLSSQNVHKTKIDVVEQITKTYYGILINEERLTILNANVERLDKIKSDTEKMYQSGFVEKIDLDRITVTYNNMNIQLANLQNVLRLGYSVLKYQMGMDMNENIKIEGSLTDNLVQGFSTENNFAYENRIEYNLMNTQRELAELNIKRHRYGYLPNLYLRGNLSAQAQRNEFNFFSGSERWFPISLVGVSMSVNLFDGLQRKYRVEQAQYELMSNENNLEKLEKGIDMEIDRARVNLENSMKSLENQKTNMGLALGIVDATNKKFNAGTATSMDVTEAEGVLTEAQSNYYNALYNALLAKIDFQKATGELYVAN